MSRLVDSLVVASFLFSSFPANSEDLTPRYVLSFGDLISRIENFSERCPNIRLKINQKYLLLEEFKENMIETMRRSTRNENVLYRFSFATELNQADQYCPLYEGFSKGGRE